MSRLNVDIKLPHNSFNVNFEIEMDGVTFCTGPSGVGKTTLLRCLAGLEKPISGHVIWNNDIWSDHKKKINLDTSKRKIALVSQGDKLFKHLDVYQNISYGFKRINEAHLFEVDQIIQEFELEDLLEKSPHQLSGGQKQKVALARSVLSSPELLLLDEPMSALDHWSKEKLYNFLKLVNVKMKIPIFYVSHNKEEFINLANNYLFFNPQIGEVIGGCAVNSSNPFETNL